MAINRNAYKSLLESVNDAVNPQVEQEDVETIDEIDEILAKGIELYGEEGMEAILSHFAETGEMSEELEELAEWRQLYSMTARDGEVLEVGPDGQVRRVPGFPVGRRLNPGPAKPKVKPNHATSPFTMPEFKPHFHRTRDPWDMRDERPLSEAPRLYKWTPPRFQHDAVIERGIRGTERGNGLIQPKYDSIPLSWDRMPGEQRRPVLDRFVFGERPRPKPSDLYPDTVPPGLPPEHWQPVNPAHIPGSPYFRPSRPPSKRPPNWRPSPQHQENPINPGGIHQFGGHEHLMNPSREYSDRFLDHPKDRRKEKYGH